MNRGRKPAVFATSGIAMIAMIAMSTFGADVTGAGGATIGPGPITEGLVVDFTGSNSFIGPAQEAAVYPAITCINDTGGILGHTMTLQTVDTRSDPADAVPVVEKFLATTNNIVGVTGIATEVAPTIVPLIEKADIPINLAAGNSIYDHTTNPYIWRAVAPDSANGEAMAIYAKEKRLNKIALVFGTDASSQGDEPGIVAGLKAEGIKVSITLGLQPDQASYRTDLSA